MINSERLVQSLKFFAWLGFLVLGALVVWFGVLSFLNPAERFPIYSEDYRLIIIFAVLLISIALLALVLRGGF